MIRITGGYSGPRLFYISGEALKKGQLIKDNASGKAVKAAAAHSGATLLGIADEAASAGDVKIAYMPIRGQLLEIDYYASATKVTLADSDMATLFDLRVDGTSGDMTINLDDTTGGFLHIMRYDNTLKKAWCTVADTNILWAV